MDSFALEDNVAQWLLMLQKIVLSLFMFVGLNDSWGFVLEAIP